MALIYGRVQLAESLGASATTKTENINFSFIANALHLDVFALKEGATASTIQDLVDKISQVRITTTNGDPESTIDGDDLFEFPKYAYGNVHPFSSKLTSTDNIPHAFGMLYPFNIFPQNPLAQYGLPAGKGVQLAYDTNADVTNDFDNYTTDVLVEGVDVADKSTNGYIKFQRDAHTFAAVDEQRDTLVSGNRLLGVYNFMTTAYDDLAASASNDVVGIREQQVLRSQNSILRYKSYATWALQKQAAIADYAAAASNGPFLDTGRWFKDFGISQNPAGINVRGQNNVQVRSTGGVAEAVRIMPVLLTN